MGQYKQKPAESQAHPNRNGADPNPLLPAEAGSQREAPASGRVPPAATAAARKRPSPGRIGAGALLLGVGLAVGSLVYAWVATHPPRRRVRTPDETEEMQLEEVEFSGRDGVRLSGWFSPHPDARGTIVLCHGHTGNRLEMLDWARLLWAEGFHTLLFDFRAAGQSDGALSTIGYLEINDLLGAIDYLETRPETAGLPLGVYGLSMGGAVAIMTAAQEPRIAVVATHGAYATLERAIHQRSRLYFGPLGPVVTKQAIWWGQRWFPEHPRNISPLDAIAQIAPRPLFLSHGERDFIVHPRDARALYEAAQAPKTLHILPRCWHVRMDQAVFPDYQRELVAFFCQNLG
jgi:uncharacterized protein